MSVQLIWAITSSLSYMNGKLLAYKGDNKKLMIIPEASHTDLYDQKDIIPFDELESFFNTYLEV